jgi:protein-disulfide isomerase
MRNIWKHLAAGAVLFLCAAGPVAAQDKAAEPPPPSGNIADLRLSDADFAIGPADAKVTIVEYASLTCPHCAEFHTKVMPDIKKAYLETGKVRYVYRDFPLDRLALAAAMTARCAGRESFFGFIDTFYAAQGQWSRAGNPIKALGNLARLGGMSEKALDTCLQNADVQNAVLKQRLEAANDFKITATPTVFVNGDRYSGGMTLDQMRTLLDRLLSKS